MLAAVVLATVARDRGRECDTKGTAVCAVFFSTLFTCDFSCKLRFAVCLIGIVVRLGSLRSISIGRLGCLRKIPVQFSCLQQLQVEGIRCIFRHSGVHLDYHRLEFPCLIEPVDKGSQSPGGVEGSPTFAGYLSVGGNPTLK